MEVELSSEAEEQLDELPAAIHSRINKLLDRLRRWPEVSGAKPLRGDLAGSYRLRTGDYRLQFHLEDDLVVIDKIGHRDGFYEE